MIEIQVTETLNPLKSDYLGERLSFLRMLR